MELIKEYRYCNVQETKLALDVNFFSRLENKIVKHKSIITLYRMVLRDALMVKRAAVQKA